MFRSIKLNREEIRYKITSAQETHTTDSQPACQLPPVLRYGIVFGQSTAAKGPEPGKITFKPLKCKQRFVYLFYMLFHTLPHTHTLLAPFWL